MTAMVEVDEQYAQKFQQFIKSMPKDAIKMTLIKHNLNAEIARRIDEIKNGSVETRSLSGLSSIRERYANR